MAFSIIMGLGFAFDVVGIATRFAGWKGPGGLGRLWERLPAPWSHVNRPGYWRIVGLEVGGILVLLGIISAIALRNVP